MKILRKLPENFIDADLQYFKPNLKIKIPEVDCEHFTSFVILLKNGILVDKLSIKKESLLYDSRLDDIGGVFTILKQIVKSIITSKVTRIVDNDCYVTIINEWTNSYFHWFTEGIPKLFSLMKEGKNPTILLPTSYDHEYQITSLDLLGFKYRFFSGDLVISKNITLPHRLAASSAQYNPSVLKYIVNELKRNMHLSLNKGSRIYVTRAKASKRKIINEAEVITYLITQDFKIVDFEDYTFIEQVSIMHHTQILVSIHGAGLTNTLFCKPNTSLLELCLKNQVMDKCYFNLANAVDVKYYYQFCNSTVETNDYHNADLFVDMTALKINFDLILKDIYV